MTQRYGTIHTAFWTDEKTSKWDDAASRLACYLMTGPHSTIAGAMRLPLAYVAADLGWSPDKARATMAFLADEGFVSYDEASSWCVVNNRLRYDEPRNPASFKGVIAVLEKMPKSHPGWPRLLPILRELSQRHRTILPAWIDALPTVPGPFPDPLATVPGLSRDSLPTVSRPSAEDVPHPQPHPQPLTVTTTPASDARARAREVVVGLDPDLVAQASAAAALRARTPGQIRKDLELLVERFDFDRTLCEHALHTGIEESADPIRYAFGIAKNRDHERQAESERVKACGTRAEDGPAWRDERFVLVA